MIFLLIIYQHLRTWKKSNTWLAKSSTQRDRDYGFPDMPVSNPSFMTTSNILSKTTNRYSREGVKLKYNWM